MTAAPPVVAAYFPDRAPLYPGSTVVSAEQTKTDAGKAANVVVLRTTDSLAKVQAWYDAVGKGFNEISAAGAPAGKSYWWDDGKKGGKADWHVSIAVDA